MVKFLSIKNIWNWLKKLYRNILSFFFVFVLLTVNDVERENYLFCINLFYILSLDQGQAFSILSGPCSMARVANKIAKMINVANKTRRRLKDISDNCSPITAGMLLLMYIIKPIVQPTSHPFTWKKRRFYSIYRL